MSQSPSGFYVEPLSLITQITQTLADLFLGHIFKDPKFCTAMA